MLITQLLGQDKLHAVENPGYNKAALTYRACGATWNTLTEMVSRPQQSRAHSAYLLPSFPHRYRHPGKTAEEIFEWVTAKEERMIIEDDYDSESPFGKPIPAMQSMDPGGKVIYMNTFSKSIAVHRISYTYCQSPSVSAFMKSYFYSGTVPSFEQYTLVKFIADGYFEKHTSAA